jgi:hypothetical protein
MDRSARPRTRRELLRCGLASLAGIGLGASPAFAQEAAPDDRALAGKVVETDLCVFGGSSAGVAAAVQARRMGKQVILLEPGSHLGGITAAGLGETDIGSRAAIGGIAREFYGRIRQYYARTYGPESQQVADCRDGFRFEPGVAERTFNDIARGAGVLVLFGQRLKGVRKNGAEIVEILMENGRIFRARMFIDATYEGDLMAKAEVSYALGREANEAYGETLNGIQWGQPGLNFKVTVDPYAVEGNPSSGLLKGISPEEPGKLGEGDRRIQAYCFRMCLTSVPENRLPLPRPKSYDPDRYTLLARYLRAGVWDAVKISAVLPNGKTDTNNNGAFSTDNIGMSYEWPEGDYATRARIFQEHLDYQQGLMWFLTHDERVPEEIRQEVGKWGLPQDEFRESFGWPHQLYIREARRMVSDYVMTEHNCRGKVTADDAIGMAAYTMDSHHCQRVVRDGRVVNEGDVQVGGFPPYPIGYRSIVPREAQCRNLLVPVCLSASHIAFGSIRMEPVFMVLGQSAATAACVAIDSHTSVQRVDRRVLRARLLADGQVLELSGAAPMPDPAQALAIDPRGLKGVVVDDPEAFLVGEWSTSALANPRRVGPGYLHDGNANKGLLSAIYTPEIPEDGSYDIVLIFPPNPSASTSVPISISVQGVGSSTVRVNQRATEKNGFVSLGTFKLPQGKATTVTVSNKGTEGHVIADAVQFIPLPS